MSAPSNIRRSQAASEDTQACKECRRRKASCDHKIPECSTCRRYKRHCLYDKHGRTPLTRRHLTEVEYRLSRAEALLKRLFSEEEVSYLLDQERSGEVPVLPPTRTVPSTPEPAVLRGSVSTSKLGSQQDGLTTPQSRTPQPQVNTSPGDPGAIWRFSGTEAEPDSSTALHPDGDEEFEWDEREQKGLGGGVAITDDNEEGVKKIMDGMATLTVDAANYGYLGMASGASHLRSLWMDTSSDPPWESGDRRRHLQDLLKRESQESILPSTFQTQALITKAMVDVFVDAFFFRYHPVFPILHEPVFRAQYANKTPRPSEGNWLVLVNIVAALGAFVTNPSATDDTSLSIFRTAKRYLAVNALETGNLTLVQAFGLSAMFLQKINKPNTGYNYGGVALRMAIGLGLHKELGSQRMVPFKQELRRRVWWALCVLDVGATVTYSRPLIWPQEGVDAAFPLNVREKDLMPGSLVAPPEVQQVTVNTYIRVQSSYHLQTMKIYNRLISNSPPTPEELLTLDSQIIETWVRNVPHYFDDHSSSTLDERFALVHGINCWRYRNLRIIMFRPLLVRWALQTGEDQPITYYEKEATDRCLRAAKESIASIQDFWKSRSQTRLTAFYVLYFLFQAALIPIHCLRCKSQSRLASEWRDQVYATLEVVESMTGMNPSGSKCRDVILSLCGTYLKDASDELFDYDQAFAFDPTMDATAWMAGCAPTLINENLWAGSLDNTSAELNFSNWDGDWNL